MSHIQMRIDAQTKSSVKKIFNAIGIDLSTGIKLFLHQVIITKGIPFKLRTRNNLSPETENEIIQASKEAKKDKNVTKSMNTKEALDYLIAL